MTDGWVFGQGWHFIYRETLVHLKLYPFIPITFLGPGTALYQILYQWVDQTKELRTFTHCLYYLTSPESVGK